MTFKLRDMFLATFVLAVVANWFAIERKTIISQQAAIRHFTDLGGKVYTEPDERLWVRYFHTLIGYGPPKRVVGIQLANTAADNETLAKIALFPEVKSLGLTGTDISDAGFKYLAPCKQLDNLWIDKTNINGEGLQHLNKSGSLTLLCLDRSAVTSASIAFLVGSRLNFISLNETQVDDEVIEYLNEMNSLETIYLDRTNVSDTGVNRLTNMNVRLLSICHTHVSDRGIKCISEFSSLENLYLTGTGISSNGIESILNCKSLQRLKIDDTKVTISEVSKIQRQLPLLRIVY